MAELVALEPDSSRNQILQELAQTEAEQKHLLYDWEFWGRPKQLVCLQDTWRFLALITGRGFGKTLTGAQWVRWRCENFPGQRIMLVGPTLMDVRETMIEGESGILQACPPWKRPVYKPSRLLLKWPNGSMAKGYGAEKPARLRGPNITGAWGDEFAAWEKPEAFKNLRMCLRKGNPQCLLTSTPRVVPAVLELFDLAKKKPDIWKIIQGSTYENLANLAETFLDMFDGLQGTRYGRQELDGELLEDVEGAFWTQGMIDFHRVEVLPTIVKRAAFVDPAASNTKDSDETGIIVCGLGANKHLYVLGDYSIKGGDPKVWLPQLLKAKKEHALDTVIYERNSGGLNLGQVIEQSAQGWRLVEDVYNTKDKKLRVEPCIPLYIRGMIHHYGRPPVTPKLEHQMTTTVPGEPNVADDRIDALVLAIHYFLASAMTVGAIKRPEGW